ncbi:MAG: glycosyltransferase [Syntrophobacteraceae bacterium]
MNIAYINDQILPLDDSDTEQFMMTVEALGDAGASVDLILPRRRRDRIPSLSQLLSYYRVHPSFHLSLVKSLFPSWRILEKLAHPIAWCRREINKPYDVIHTRNISTVAVCLAMTSVPVVFETYRPWPQQYPILNPFFRYIEKHPRFLGIITHSRFAAVSLGTIGIPEEKLLAAYNGYSPNRMLPRLERTEARRAIGVENERPIVTYTGHIYEGKGLQSVLDMAEAVPDALFFLVGSTRRTTIEQQAERLSNVHVIRWQPFQNVLPYLYAADVLLIPPTSGPLMKEGDTVLPLKTYLYMAAGKAILAAATPDICEVLTNGANARLVPPDNQAAAVQALRELIDNPLRAAELGGQVGLDARNFTYRRRAECILSFFEKRLAVMQLRTGF